MRVIGITYDTGFVFHGANSRQLFGPGSRPARCFVFIFALYDHPHRPGGDPRDDLDLASYGMGKVFKDRHGDTYPEMPWEPKAAFATEGEYYRDHRA